MKCLNLRHSEIFISEDNKIVIKSLDRIGRYSMWFDHSDVSFKDVYKINNFEFSPYKIHFLVPLFKPDLYFLCTENSNGIVSEQFIYCTKKIIQENNIYIQNFFKWFLMTTLRCFLNSVTFWLLLIALPMQLEFFQFKFVSLLCVVFAVLFFKTKFYLFKKVMVVEVLLWLVISSYFIFIN